MLNNAPFTAPSPAGWPDIGDYWISADSLMNRIEILHMIARRTIPRGETPIQAAQGLIGPVASQDTIDAIERSPSKYDIFALTMASAEFQRR